VDGADERSLGEAVLVERANNVLLVAARLEVDEEADAGQLLREQRQGRFERVTEAIVTEHEPRQHVHLDHVRTELDGKAEALQRVLRSERGGPAVTDEQQG